MEILLCAVFGTCSLINDNANFDYVFGKMIVFLIFYLSLAF